MNEEIIRIEHDGVLLEIDVNNRSINYVHDDEHPSLNVGSEPVDGKLLIDKILQVVRGDGREVVIRTFGNFDVFVDGVPIKFRCTKGKELLAVLVDRRGGYITNKEIISYLWENEGDIDKLKVRLRKVMSRLKAELKELGLESIIDSDKGQKRIIADRVKCDYFDYMDNPTCAVLSPESYMREYSWAENTIPALLDR